MIKSILSASILVGSAFTPALAEVASVEVARQFPDVQPTDWAYQAILNLKEKYGCAVGYPSGNFLPNRAASRSELAALVNHCLDNIANYVDEQDRATAEALRKEFAVEIAALEGRVTALEVIEERKRYEVGTYLGAGVTFGNRVTDDTFTFNGNNSLSFSDADTDTYAGVGLQARVPLFSGLGGEFSARPFVAFTGGPRNSTLVNGGGTITYDFPISRKTLADGTKVSRANLYGGVGYSASKYYGLDYPSSYNGTKLDTSDGVVFVVGAEGALTRRLVVFGDVKLPASSNDQTGQYEAQGIVGFGFKF